MAKRKAKLTPVDERRVKILRGHADRVLKAAHAPANVHDRFHKMYLIGRAEALEGFANQIERGEL